jgi:hypothetical protein
MHLLERFGLTIHLGAEVATALLTLVNIARRALLGGIEIVGLQDAPCLIPLAPDRRLSAAIGELGGRSYLSRERIGPPPSSAIPILQTPERRGGGSPGTPGAAA